MQLGNTDLYGLNIEVMHRGKVQLDASWRSKNAKAYFTRLYYVKSGNGYLQDGDQTISLQPGHIYLIPSEYDFGFGCVGLEKIFFHILLPAGEKTDILKEIGRILVLPNEEACIQQLYEAYGKEDMRSLIQVKKIIYDTLFNMIVQHDLQFSGGRDLSALTTEALRYIWTHVSVKLSAHQIAQRMYVSESTLRNTFKEETGRTIGEYVDDAVFFTVQKMLTAGFSIEEISAKLHFCDRHYLSRRFKEKLGKTISDYRKDQFA